GAAAPEADAEEAAALRRALCGRPRSAPLLLGSVKANLGHTEGASGAAAVVKVALSLHHGEIPPTPGLGRPNPGLGPEVEVNSGRRAWSAESGIRLAAVDGMGFGGVSYHLLLENHAPAARAPARQPAAPQTGLCFLFPGQGSQYPGMMREVAQAYP